MDSQNARKIDERRLEFLIHERLFFTADLNADDPEPETYSLRWPDLYIHRDMFEDWRGNLDDVIRKKRFGGKGEVSQAEIDAWRNFMRKRYEVSEALLWKNHFADRDETTVTSDELDQVRWTLDEQRREVEREERRAARKKAEEIEFRRSRGLPDEFTWQEGLADVLCLFPLSIGYPLIIYQLIKILARSARTEKEVWIFVGTSTLAFILLVLLCVWIRRQFLKRYLTYGDSVRATHDSNGEEKMILLVEKDKTPSEEYNYPNIGSSKHSSRKFLGVCPKKLSSAVFMLHVLITIVLVLMPFYHIIKVENPQ